MRYLIVIFSFLYCLIPTAGWSDSNDLWYVYEFTVKTTYSGDSKHVSKCAKSESSPETLMQKLDKRGLPYKLVEQLTRKSRPLVVDIQVVDAREAGYEYRSHLTAPEGYESVTVVTDRFVKGEKLCRQIREDHASGKLAKRLLDRYK